ncbi:MAG: hypothetical protein KF746_15755 [Chitinophagaceae bacterium]|nr:hypothetical protein [Chitinophagaceae bacterium]
MRKGIPISFLLMLLTACSCNNKEPLDALPNIGGYVIGRETCTSDPHNDYWLIDFTAYPDQLQMGDTLVFDGITYTNVLKVKGLSEGLQQIGMAVAFDYKEVTPGVVITSGCTVANPVTYALKELFIINQFEIR